MSLVFIMKSHFKVPKDVTLHTKNYFIMKIPNKRSLKQVAFNHSSDIDLENFMNLYKKFTAKPYSFLVAGTTLVLDKPLRFKKNLLERI